MNNLNDITTEEELLAADHTKWAQLNEALDRLHENKDFQAVILEGYFRDTAVDIVSMLAHEYTKMNNQRGELMERLIGISRLEEHFRVIRSLRPGMLDEDDETLSPVPGVYKENVMVNPQDMTDDELEAAFRAAKEELNQEVTLEASDDLGEPASSDVEPDDETVSIDNEEEEEDENVDAGDEDNATLEADSDATDDVEPVAPPARKVRANGKEYEMSEQEMLEQFPRFFGQAMDYHKKMKTIKPWRQSIDALQQAKLKHEDVNLMIDVFKGDKAATAALLKRTGVDPMDLNPEETVYTQNNYGRNEATLNLQDVLDDIKDDPEYGTTHNILSKTWDDTSWEHLSSDPENIRLLHIDVKSGVYAKLQPIMQKLKVFDQARKSDIDYYYAAANEYYQKESEQSTRERTLRSTPAAQSRNTSTRIAQVQADTQKRAEAQTNATRRKAAATTGTTASKGGPVDYLSASDEDFDEWYKKVLKGDHKIPENII